MKLHRPTNGLAVLLACFCQLVVNPAQAAEEHAVSQKNKAFSIKKLTIK